MPLHNISTYTKSITKFNSLASFEQKMRSDGCTFSCTTGLELRIGHLCIWASALQCVEDILAITLTFHHLHMDHCTSLWRFLISLAIWSCYFSPTFEISFSPDKNKIYNSQKNKYSSLKKYKLLILLFIWSHWSPSSNISIYHHLITSLKLLIWVASKYLRINIYLLSISID